jgi:uncharacterized Zn-binding protein involved in type VI secretion
MGQPAARISDPDTNGKITEGSANVFIGGLGAACKGNMVSCGSAIVGGSKTVFIDDKPAARVGDLVGCGNAIAHGCDAVLGD